MTVGELLERISSQEMSEWMAFYELEPFGAVRQDRAELLLGQQLQLVANVNRDPKRSRAFALEDVMPWYKAQRPRQTVKEQLAIVEALNRQFGGDDLRKR